MGKKTCPCTCTPHNFQLHNLHQTEWVERKREREQELECELKRSEEMVVNDIRHLFAIFFCIHSIKIDEREKQKFHKDLFAAVCHQFVGIVTRNSKEFAFSALSRKFVDSSLAFISFTCVRAARPVSRYTQVKLAFPRTRWVNDEKKTTTTRTTKWREKETKRFTFDFFFLSAFPSYDSLHFSGLKASFFLAAFMYGQLVCVRLNAAHTIWPVKLHNSIVGFFTLLLPVHTVVRCALSSAHSLIHSHFAFIHFSVINNFRRLFGNTYCFGQWRRPFTIAWGMI